MGEFHDNVSTLLQAFTSGLSIIKTQRSRRKAEKTQLDPTRKAAESTLSRSLKRNRKEVKSAYENDVKTFGAGFVNGDEEAHSRLASILLRLNAGFVSIIERFTRGKSSVADYNSLISLSNSSRIEAMKTFEQLSHRISQSSLVLSSTSDHPNQQAHRRKRKTKKGSSSSKSRSKEELASSPLGVASPNGWVRPKHGRKSSSESMSKGSGSSSPRKAAVEKSHPSANNVVMPKALPAPLQNNTIKPLVPTSSPPIASSMTPPPLLAHQTSRTVNRKSIMSFASDSTKLGEIPEYKWIRPGMLEAVGEGGNIKYPVTTFYPIEPYVEPQKRSRLRRMFGIS